MSIEGLKNRRLSLDQSSSSSRQVKSANGVGAKGTPPPVRKTRLVSPKLLWNVEPLIDGPNHVKTPFDIAFLPNRNIVVSEIGNKQLQIFDTDGKSVRRIATDEIVPRGVAVDRHGNQGDGCYGNIITTDTLDNTVWVFTSEGDLVTRWEPQVFKEPCGVAVTNSGKYVITDTAPDTPKIFICEPDGHIINAFGNTLPGNHYLKSPNYIAVDQYDRIIVSDWDSHCVKIFDTDGKFLSEFGPNSDLQYPNGVFADYLDNIMVVDNGNHRVSLYSASGHLMQHMLEASDGLYWPEGLAVSDGGVMAITENGVGTEGVRAYQV